jgi:polyphosphate kinase 2
MAKNARLKKGLYEAELVRLQAELVTMQEWVKREGERVVLVFEGRDAAGKGSAIKRVTEYLNPRSARVVALPTPTERQRTQWYFQRYIEHLPTAGEIVLFDRSWYNRAGVERVLGYCTPQEHQRFLRQCPIVERMLVEDGIRLHKYWFSVSDAEQQRRFECRLTDPMRRWKLSTTDVESITHWEDYSRAKDEMMVHTDITAAPWLGRRERGQASLAAQHDRPPALPGALRGGGGAGGRDAPAAAVARLRAGGPLAAAGGSGPLSDLAGLSRVHGHRSRMPWHRSRCVGELRSGRLDGGVQRQVHRSGDRHGRCLQHQREDEPRCGGTVVGQVEHRAAQEGQHHPRVGDGGVDPLEGGQVPSTIMRRARRPRRRNGGRRAWAGRSVECYARGCL